MSIKITTGDYDNAFKIKSPSEDWADAAMIRMRSNSVNTGNFAPESFMLEAIKKRDNKEMMRLFSNAIYMEHASPFEDKTKDALLTEINRRYEAMAANLVSNPLWHTNLIKLNNAHRQVVEEVSRATSQQITPSEKTIIDKCQKFICSETLKELAQQASIDHPEWYENYDQKKEKIASLLSLYYLNSQIWPDKAPLQFLNLARRIRHDPWFKLSKKQWRKFVVNNSEAKTLFKFLKKPSPYKKGQIVTVNFPLHSRPIIKESEIAGPRWARALSSPWYSAFSREKLHYESFKVRRHSLENYLELGMDAIYLFPVTSIILEPHETKRYHYVKLIDKPEAPLIAIEQYCICEKK